MTIGYLSNLRDLRAGLILNRTEGFKWKFDAPAIRSVNHKE